MNAPLKLRYDHRNGVILHGDNVVARVESPYVEDRDLGRLMALAPLLVDRLISIWGMAMSAEGVTQEQLENLLAAAGRQARRCVAEAFGLAEDGFKQDLR